jgi:hypothetical protein
MLSISMPNEKARVLLQGRLGFIDAAHLRPARAFPKHPGQLVELRGITGRVDLNIAVVPVPYPAVERKRTGGALYKISEADALHASPHTI